MPGNTGANVSDSSDSGGHTCKEFIYCAGIFGLVAVGLVVWGGIEYKKNDTEDGNWTQNHPRLVWGIVLVFVALFCIVRGRKRSKTSCMFRLVRSFLAK